jgi:hypothetical protein
MNYCTDLWQCWFSWSYLHYVVKFTSSTLTVLSLWDSFWCFWIEQKPRSKAQRDIHFNKSPSALFRLLLQLHDNTGHGSRKISTFELSQIIEKIIIKCCITFGNGWHYPQMSCINAGNQTRLPHTSVTNTLFLYFISYK